MTREPGGTVARNTPPVVYASTGRLVLLRTTTTHDSPPTLRPDDAQAEAADIAAVHIAHCWRTHFMLEYDRMFLQTRVKVRGVDCLVRD
jgi:hypothetical protein